MPPPPVGVRDEFVLLRLSEERLQLAIQAAEIGTCDWNLTSGELVWSPLMEQIYGFAPGCFEATRAAFERLIFPADLEFVRHATDACLNEKIPYDIEFRAVTPAGALRWISERAEVIRDESGQAIRWLGAARDITAKKKIEQRLAAQYAVTAVLAESGTFREAAPRILRAVCEGLDWETGAVWMVDADSDSLNFLDIWPRREEESSPFGADRFRCGVSLPGDVWKSGKAQWVFDSAADQAGLRSGFGFPLRIGSEIVGVLEFFTCNLRQEDPDIIRLADSFGAQIGHAIERMRAQDALRRSYQIERDLRQRAERARERTARLQAVISELSLALTCEQVADVIVTQTIAAMDARQGSVHVLSDDGSTFRYLLSAGSQELDSIPADALRMLPDAIRNRELIAFSTLVAIPLFSNDRAAGGILLAFDQERSFDAEDRDLMRNIAQQCAQALERARLHDAKMAARTSVESSLHALQVSEAKFRRLIESNVIGVVFGEGDLITGANRRFLETVGYNYEDLLARKLHWQEMTPPEFRRFDEHALGELRDRGSFTPFVKEYFRKDGSRVPVLTGGAALQPGTWVCFVVDLTEDRRLQEQLLRSQKIESLGVLAVGIAHDFNNLLTSVIGNASLAREIAPPGDIQTLLDIVINSGLKASHLTRQMLAYAGKGRANMQPVDLAQLVREMHPLLRAAIPEAVALEIEAAAPAAILADSSEMEQLVMNLVLNAAEAIEPGASGSVRIAIGLETLNGQDAEITPGPHAALRVEDSGIGMDEETRRKIFDPFFTTKFTGRGLGLAAVSGIVRGHHGAIRVSSRPGAGATFTVYFPEARQADSVAGTHSLAG